MIRWSALVLASVLAYPACVPSTDETDPRGGVSVAFHPSPGSRGQPFTTADGWTVYVDSFAIQAFITVTPQDGRVGGFGGLYVFDASKEQQFVVRAIPAGAATTSVTFAQRPVGTSDYGPGDPPSDHGVDAALDARFTSPPEGRDPLDDDDDDDDDDSADGGVPVDASTPGAIDQPSGLGPAFVLAVHAEKGTRLITFDFSLDGFSSANDQPVAVRADALTSGDLLVTAEGLFTRDGVLGFDDIARADADGDGLISAAELNRVDVPPCTKCPRPGTGAVEPTTLSHLLYFRAANVFVP